jgi:hypothetical protein
LDTHIFTTYRYFSYSLRNPVFNPLANQKTTSVNNYTTGDLYNKQKTAGKTGG